MTTLTVYMTTKAIQNPLGDGRHDRAQFRSFLEKSTIPAGFVFAIDDTGNIEDRSVAKFTVAARFAGTLRDLLLQNCTRPLGFGEPPPPAEPATVEEAIQVFGGAEVVAKGLCEALGIKASDLRELLQKVAAPPAPQKQTKAGKAAASAAART